MHNPNGITWLRIHLRQERHQKLQHKLQYMAKYMAVGLQIRTICNLMKDQQTVFLTKQSQTLPTQSFLKEDEKKVENDQKLN